MDSSRLRRGSWDSLVTTKSAQREVVRKGAKDKNGKEESLSKC